MLRFSWELLDRKGFSLMVDLFCFQREVFQNITSNLGHFRRASFLAESMRAEAAIELQVDPRFIAPLDPVEKKLIMQQWQGGSVRRLRRMLPVG